MRGKDAADLAGRMKGIVIGDIEKQVISFFQLLVIAHRAAKTANPPSKLVRILNEGLVTTAEKIKAANRQ